MTSLLWTLIAIQIVMGVFDTFYHHELTERLAWRPSQRYELKLHGVRNVMYALLFLVLGWLEVHGIFAMLIVAVLVAEIVITLMDFVEEDMSRQLRRHPGAAAAGSDRMGNAADRDQIGLHGMAQHDSGGGKCRCGAVRA